MGKVLDGGVDEEVDDNHLHLSPIVLDDGKILVLL